jgi:hypothetical protein
MVNLAHLVCDLRRALVVYDTEGDPAALVAVARLAAEQGRP